MDRALRLGIEAALAKVLDRSVHILDFHQASGGCIHRCYRLETDCGEFFLKLNSAQFADHFEAEADGLRALRNSDVRAPYVLCSGCEKENAYLLLEYLEFGEASPSMYTLGAAVARMHECYGPGYGWNRDNYIGATPQHNAACATWPEFWGLRRLAPQLAFARRNGHRSLEEPGQRLLEALPALLGEHHPSPSLLHGDLWNGNVGALRDGTPVLFDPAVYYGDAETDLAMTELFGGFGPDFIAGYRSVRHIDPGYERRKPLYQLYHLLNHLTLFGVSYLRQCEASMLALLDSCKGKK